MSDMFWIALKLSIPKIGLNIVLSLTVKKLDAFKFDGVAESDNTGKKRTQLLVSPLRRFPHLSEFLKKLIHIRKV